jgi:N utilization substance protein A
VGEANMDEATANEIIMAARAHWFGDEPVADEVAAGSEDAGGETDHG